MLGVDINDRRFVVAADGTAIAHSAVALPASAGAAGLAALLAQQLPSGMAGGAWIALAPPADPHLPGELLRVLRAAGHQVQGFVDRAAVLASWLPGTAGIVVVEQSRRRFSISLVAKEGGVAALRRHVPLRGGDQALQDAWVRLAAATLVQQTRFDPLHDARHEAELRERISQLAVEAGRDGQGQCDIGTGSGTARLVLTRDQLAAAAAPVLTDLQLALQGLAAAHGDAALLVEESLLAQPGIDALLPTAGFSALYRMADGLPARAASVLAGSAATAGGGVPYLTQLPIVPTSAPRDALLPVERGALQAAPMATHVVYGGRVVPIPAGGLVIGRDPGPAPSVQVPEGRAGLSRRHCTLRRDATRSQVIDHSSHGTFLDGARVRGRALLRAGATLRLGDPGVELQLVAIGN
jgi:hypothetical protein